MIGAEHEGALLRGRAVFTISTQGKLTGGELYADLVGSSRMQANVKQRIGGLGLPYGIVQRGFFDTFTFSVYDEGFIACAVEKEKIGEGCGAFLGDSAEDGEVFFFELLLGDGAREACRRFLRTGKDHDPFGFAIEAVDGEDRAIGFALAGELFLEQVGQGILGVSLGKKSRRLMADQHGSVAIENFDRFLLHICTPWAKAWRASPLFLVCAEELCE